MAAEFHSIFPDSSPSWFASRDPAGRKLGSGGGAAQLLADAWRGDRGDFGSWLDGPLRVDSVSPTGLQMTRS